MAERRRLVRWRINRQAEVKLEGSENFSRSTVNDINFKGIKISLPLKLPEDTPIKLSVVLSEDYVINIEAWVAWHKTIGGFYSYGIYFTRIKDEDKEKIYQFIRQDFPQQINSQWWREMRKEGGETMQEQNFEDRRIFERFTAKFPLRFIDLKENREGEASTQDISAKGVGFLSKEEMRAHTPLEMWLEIPDKAEPLYARGEVMWSKSLEPNQHRIGVNLEKADLMGLSRVLRLA